MKLVKKILYILAMFALVFGAVKSNAQKCDTTLLQPIALGADTFNLVRSYAIGISSDTTIALYYEVLSSQGSVIKSGNMYGYPLTFYYRWLKGLDIKNKPSDYISKKMKLQTF